jgi:PPK2 family polyphosphate:nucleotide phosphotransferase
MHARRVDPDKKVHLKEFDPEEDGGLEKGVAEARTEALGRELSELQSLMFEAGKHALLIVLQGRDTSGKDGTIRCLAHYMNMQGCRVASFKVPTEEESHHDFLWRIHQQAPKKGSATIFNRSHYEDVLVVRVHGLISKKEWQRRYSHINQFEELLTDSGTLIAKFYLHISKQEQEQRLLDREKEQEKAWKLSVGDWKERELWGSYTEAYEDALTKCSTPFAPWYVVPANHKWFRNLAVVEALVETLRPFKKEWTEQLEQIGEEAKKELAAYRGKA